MKWVAGGWLDASEVPGETPGLLRVRRVVHAPPARLVADVLEGRAHGQSRLDLRTRRRRRGHLEKHGERVIIVYQTLFDTMECTSHFLTLHRGERGKGAVNSQKLTDNTLTAKINMFPLPAYSRCNCNCVLFSMCA